eukprot:6172605-Pleurochrysis_carterae.AAC.1
MKRHEAAMYNQGQRTRGESIARHSEKAFTWEQQLCRAAATLKFTETAVEDGSEASTGGNVVHKKI